MTIINKTAAILWLIFPVLAFIYIISGTSTPEHPRYGNGTFPLGLAAYSFLASAATWLETDNPMDDMFSHLISGWTFLGGIGFTLIFLWALLSGLPLVPA